MVVLDQDGVIQAEAVVRAAAAAHGVFLQRSPSGRRLARVHDPHRGNSGILRQPPRPVREAAGLGRDARKPLEKIERRALRRQDAAGPALYRGEPVAGLGLRTFGRHSREGGGGVDFAHHEAQLPYGVIGIKVWIYRGNIYADTAKAK